MEMQNEAWFYPSLVTLVITLVSFLLLFIALLKKKKTGTRSAAAAAAAVTTPQNNTQIAPASSSSNNSSTIISPSPPPAGWDYEVFLSFRGADTRTSFTDYLYNDLVDGGIRTFRDDDELRVGEKIGPELLNAIRQSKISIPIFSANYASSKWCLMELAQMVDCMRSSACQMILPIFYDVEPSHVRNQTGPSFGKAFRNHEKRFDGETVAKWKGALREVAELKGWEVEKFADGHQGKLIKDVVSKVLKELKKKYLVLSDCLVGLDYHVEEMMRLLSVGSENVTIVGIHGMGGIGKTTISKVVYNKLVEHFECCSFLADVRETSQQQKGLINLQNKLLSDILKGKEFNVTNSDEGINMIKDRFCNKKVLIVLDDIDQRFHLDALAGKRDWFGSGSRIIITTRNKDVLNMPQVDWIYEAKEMDSNQSLQLFSKHAFRSDHPPVEFDALSRDVVSTASGLPLALEIIGSFLYGKEKTVWKDTVKKLQRIPNDQVQKKLRISYEALDYEQKQIFLDIACLVIGMDKRIASHMWDDCEFYPENGIEVLLLMSLMKIGENNELRMHDQLRSLGREIIREENFKEPGKRSRLWYHQDALDILESHEGSRKVEALCLDFAFESRVYCFTNEEFAKLSNLRFLQIDFANMAGDFKHLFLKLRWLRWNGCPQDFKQTNFHLKNLVILDLSWSKVTESWEGWSLIKMAKKLKVLNLTRCSYLNRTPDFSSYATLERLVFEDCESLVQIDPSIGHLKSLVFFNVKNCAKLKELPIEFGSLESLVEFLMDGTSIQEVPVSGGLMKKLEIISATCSGSLTRISSSIGRLVSLSDLAFDSTRITELPDSVGSLVKLRRLSLRHCLSLKKLPESIGKLESLTELHLHSARITELPDSIGNLKNLRVLDIEFSFITKLPDVVGMLEKLEEINAWHCYSLEGEISSNYGRLSSLRILRLQCTKISGLPMNISGLPHLQTLDVIGCRELRLLPELPSSLMSLHVTCVLMRTFPNLSNLINLKELHLSGCLKLMEIPKDIGKLSKLETLTLYEINISTLPVEIGALSRLKELVIQFAEQLKCLPILPSGLFKLCLGVCESMEGLPDLSDLKNLSELTLGHCLKLTEIRGLGQLELLTSLDVSECEKLHNLDGLQKLVFLRYLNTSRCKSLQTLPDLSKLKKLQKLVTLHCKKLSEIPGVDRLESLEYLNMSWCISMEKSPDLSNLEMLKNLVLIQCEKLREIEGLEVLKSIERLNLSLCTSLEKLPNLSNLKNLEELLLHNCEKLTEIHGLEELQSLAVLDISGCKLVERLPDLSNIKEVMR